MSNCLIGLGSNLGDRAAVLDGAVAALEQHPRIRVVAKSRWTETAPIGGPAGQDPYLNGAVRLETVLEPEPLLDVLQRIEGEAGRTRDVRWGPRTLDLDLLLYDDMVQSTPRLTIPHPRLAFRRFVLEGAVAVAAEMIHPTVGWTIGRLRKHLNDAPNLVALAGPPGPDKSRLADALCQATGARRIAGEHWRRLGQLLSGSSGEGLGTAIEFLQLDETIAEIPIPKLIIVVEANEEADLANRIAAAAVGPVLMFRANAWDQDLNEAVAAIQSIQ